MSAELPADSPDGAADDTPKVFDKEDDDGRYVNDDNLSDIKEDLVDEARETANAQGSDGNKSDSDDKEKKPLSLYPAELATAANLFSNPLFGSGLASMLNPYAGAAAAGLHPYSSLYASAATNPDVEKAGLFPGQFGGLPHPFNPWSPYGAAAGALGGLRYPFPGLRPQLPGVHNSPFSPSAHASAASRAAEEKKAEMERKKAAKNAKPHIKKPLNAFMLYMKEQRAKVVSECTLKESAAINQILGRKWHALSKEEQQKYYEMARKEREKHMVLYPGWSARDNYGKRKKETPSSGQMVEEKRRKTSTASRRDHTDPDTGRKKKCVRYPEGDNFSSEHGSSAPNGSGGLFGTGSPLHGLHGMLQNSPLSPAQLGQGSPNSFIGAHSPLASMMPDQSTLAAHQHLMSAFNGSAAGLLPRTTQATPVSLPGSATSSFATQAAAQLQAHFNSMSQINKLETNERHTPQSDEHSAGSGSVGAGPRLGQINGTIDVKLEEADDQLSPCVSPEPEEQPLKKMRIDPKCEILNRSSIAT